jgi:hypothetical protein
MEWTKESENEWRSSVRLDSESRPRIPRHRDQDPPGDQTYAPWLTGEPYHPGEPKVGPLWVVITNKGGVEILTSGTFEDAKAFAEEDAAKRWTPERHPGRSPAFRIPASGLLCLLVLALALPLPPLFAVL